MNGLCREEQIDHRFLPFFNDLKKYCYFLSKNRWDGDDLTQEVMLKAIKSSLYRTKKKISQMREVDGFPASSECEDEAERKILIETIQQCITQQDPDLLIHRIPFNY